MIVLDSTLVGYSVINGTWQMQLAMLVAQLYNNLTYDRVIFLKIQID